MQRLWWICKIAYAFHDCAFMAQRKPKKKTGDYCIAISSFFFAHLLKCMYRNMYNILGNFHYKSQSRTDSILLPIIIILRCFVFHQFPSFPLSLSFCCNVYDTQFDTFRLHHTGNERINRNKWLGTLRFYIDMEK